MDAAGNLFGTTLVGGKSCPKETCGVVYAFKGNKTRPFHVLYDFCSVSDCADGSGPTGNLLLGDSGELFGTASQGGGNDIDQDQVGGGVVFQLTGTAYQKLYAFCARSSCKDGQYPNGTIVRDAGGNIFGTTLLGGSGTKPGGVVFELEP